MTDQPQISHQEQPAKRVRRGLGRDATVAAACGLLVAFMVGASYAAVPLYNWFCRATGFNGTTMVASSAPATGPIARKIAVRFDANVSGGLPWKFRPGAERDRGQDRRGRDRVLHRDQPVRPYHLRTGCL